MDYCKPDIEKKFDIKPGEEDISSLAALDGVETLYKYMSYPCNDSNDAENDGTALHNAKLRKRVEDLLMEGKLYFPKVEQLNDPYEASPEFVLPDISLEDMIDIFSTDLTENHGPRNNLSLGEIRVKNDELVRRINDGSFLAHVKQLRDEWVKYFRQTRVSCLSTTRSSALMWSYYSEGHCGVCVHFDSRAQDPLLNPFAVAMRVIYSDSPASIMMPMARNESMSLITKILLTKAKYWCGEQEYRLGNFEGILNGLIQWESAAESLAILKPQQIVGVTVGIGMKSAEVAAILQACNLHDYPVHQVCKIESSFKLGFKLIRPKQSSAHI